MMKRPPIPKGEMATLSRGGADPLAYLCLAFIVYQAVQLFMGFAQ